MAIKVSCSECGESFSVRDEAAGKRVKCRACGTAISVPVSRKKRDDMDPWEQSTPALPPARMSSPRGGTRAASPKRKSLPGWAWALIIAGGSVFLCCGGGVLAFRGLMRTAENKIAEIEKTAQVPGLPAANSTTDANSKPTQVP